MGRTWAARVLIAGVFLAGLATVCAVLANRDGTAVEWVILGVLLLGPYCLAAVGCGWSAARLDGVLAAIVVLTGLVIAGVAVVGFGQAGGDDVLPIVPAGMLSAAVLVVVQYVAGAMAAVGGLMAKRSKPSDTELP